MKGIKVTLAVAASALLLAAPAMAFHDGGVAGCEGCHTMHNSLDGTTMGGGTQFQVAGYLLRGAGTQTDACLVCHGRTGQTGPSSYQVATPAAELDYAAGNLPKQMGPGGDFGWLTLNTNDGYKRGHNVLATTFGLSADGRFAATSPGGDYPANAFHCSSCHDPHGKYRYVSDGSAYAAESTTGAPIVGSGSYAMGSQLPAGQAIGTYRILAGQGYTPRSAPSHSFSYNAPVAIAPSTYNMGESTAQAVVAYGSNMSEWCANCHIDLLENSYASGIAGHTHPAGNAEKLDDFIVTNYTNYVASGNPTGGKGFAGYNTLVPFEVGFDINGRTAAEGLAGVGVAGPTAAATANVSCLSCHRAHASGFNSMLRYSPDTYMTVEDGSGNTVYSTTAAVDAYMTRAYYDRPADSFIAYQRTACNKCHNKD